MADDIRFVAVAVAIVAVMCLVAPSNKPVDTWDPFLAPREVVTVSTTEKMPVQPLPARAPYEAPLSRSGSKPLHPHSCSTQPPVRLLSYRDWVISDDAEPEFAFATYLDSPALVHAASVLMHSIAMTGSRFARVVCVTDAIGVKHRASLAKLAEVVVMERVPDPPGIRDRRYLGTFNKLRVWQLTQFKKVLYVDVDVVVVKNIDEIFDLREWAVPLDAEERRYSSGMMLLEPSQETFSAMIKYLNGPDQHLDLPDLTFLNQFFLQRPSKPITKPVPFHGPQQAASHERITPLSRWYQVYQLEFAREHRSYLVDRKHALSIFDPRVHGIHYPGAGKPWDDYSSRSRMFAPHLCNQSEDFAHDPNFWWYLHNHWMHQSLAQFHVEKEFEYDYLPEILLAAKPRPERRPGWSLSAFVFPARLAPLQLAVLFGTYACIVGFAVMWQQRAVQSLLASIPQRNTSASVMVRSAGVLPDVITILACLVSPHYKRTIKIGLASTMSSPFLMLTVAPLALLLSEKRQSRNRDESGARGVQAFPLTDGLQSLVRGVGPLLLMTVVSLLAQCWTGEWAPIAQQAMPLVCIVAGCMTALMVRSLRERTGPRDHFTWWCISRERRRLVADGSLPPSHFLKSEHQTDSLQSLLQPAFDQADIEGTGTIDSKSVWFVLFASFPMLRRKRCESFLNVDRGALSLDALAAALMRDAHLIEDPCMDCTQGPALLQSLCSLVGSTVVLLAFAPAVIAATDELAQRLGLSVVVVASTFMPMLHHGPLLCDLLCMNSRPAASDEIVRRTGFCMAACSAVFFGVLTLFPTHNTIFGECLHASLLLFANITALWGKTSAEGMPGLAALGGSTLVLAALPALSPAYKSI